MSKAGSASKVQLSSFDDLFGNSEALAGIEQVQMIQTTLPSGSIKNTNWRQVRQLSPF